ncbi:hypothetical protein FRACYDRAFT_250182 [Fragilariopsis cylindrus CCMP1102]|uniref:Uncharacterized protein n=1 Tax=Fragilariopsis cylindrus CCMP1102 TaxID=635003 RepID=A0A1E7ERD3_9STRA|nr:hypothetical protein FRACYDRAFT_250182 [Fragilariopsis cylindrus CCMP1102]|eukprot:OEU08389.1 hypothetical protein FRACYDRAFT_250182 [Fragilariopsis cylindrus CCMP1102]
MGTKNNNNSNMMLWRRLNVGSEIAVYSKEYKGYFACSVIKTKNKSSSLFQVEYEDDSTEWTDLSKVKFRWQDLDDEEFDSDNDDTTTSSTSSNKRMKKEDNTDDDNNDCEKDDRDKEEHTGIKKLVVPESNPMQVASKKKSTKTEDNDKSGDDDSHDAVMTDDKTTSTIKKLSSKEVKKAHDNKELTKQNALLKIMVNHHMVGTTYLTFEQIFKDLGFKPKDKAIEQAWKEVCAKKLVEEANVSDSAKKYFQLTPEGIDLAASEDYRYQLANPPQTTEELHEQIKKSASKCGVQIFDLLLKNGSMSTDELADECGVSKKGHNFVHGFKQHKTFGYVIKDPNSKRASWILSPDKAFIN